MKYRVYIDENPRLADTSARMLRGEFDRREDAVAAARETVDGFLADAYQAGMTADQLLEHFVKLGEDPFILPDDEKSPFNGQAYARRRCREICDS